jgi:hypothetical protein
VHSILNNATDIRKTALLISVEDTIVPNYSSSDTQDGDRYRDNIEDVLIYNDFDRDDIKKVNNPSKDEFLSMFEAKIKELKQDDFMVFYFYGHGGQLYDVSGDEKVDNPNDNEDETLVMYDDVVLDDEIYAILLSHNVKAKVLFIIECCNSGTSIKLHEESLMLHNEVLEGNKSVKQTANEKESPKLDIIYVGATVDGTTVPSNLFNRIFIETFEDDTYTSYLDFFEELSRQMLKKEVIISIGFSMASEEFINQPPLK